MKDTVKTERWLSLLSGATATSSAPTTASQGVAIPQHGRGKTVVLGFRHTATGARTFTVTLWGYCPGSVSEADGHPNDGTAVASSAAWHDLGESVSLASVAADGAFSHAYECLSVYTRLYVRVTAISGTSCTVAVDAAFTEA